MAKVRTTITICVCDRCGSQHNEADYMKGSEWGQLAISWKGDKGGRSWQGDAGGISLAGLAWLCLPCTDAFLEFMKPKAEAQEPQR